MVAKRGSPASGNKAGSKRKPAGNPGAKKGDVWGQRTADLEEDGVDLAGKTVPATEPAQQPEELTPPVEKPKRGRKAAEGHTPAGDASPDSAVNLTNMTSDLVKGVESLERTAEEIGALKDDIKEIMGGLKSKGYSTKIIRKALARRRMDPDQRVEEDDLLELYEEALRGA